MELQARGARMRHLEFESPRGPCLIFLDFDGGAQARNLHSGPFHTLPGEVPMPLPTLLWSG